MRLTIASKIALAITTVAMLSIGTMAWITSQNLKSGFITYLSELEAQDLERLSKLLAEDYRRHGSFERFQHNRRPMRDLLDQLREPPRPGSDRDQPPPPPMRPRLRQATNGSEYEPTQEHPPPPPDAPPEQRPPLDPTRFGQRISLIDRDGHALIGPADAPGGTIRPIMLDQQQIGTLRLAPLRQISNASGIDFVSLQIRHTLWLATLLIVISIIFSFWLARHLLRPVASLHRVTERISRGQFQARIVSVRQDELGDLARHINAMAITLQENEAQRSKMLADISHELRTPLTVILGEIEALLDGIRTATPAALESLHAEVLRLNKLVDDIRQLTLADSGGLHYQRQTMDIGELLRDILRRYQARIEAAGLSLRSQLPESSLLIHGDAGRLTQVISNLLENSIRYTDAGGRIHCDVSTKGKFVQISIEDSLPGVPPHAHAMLFDRLYRVDPARSRECGGSGLGLSICKALVEAHDGRIDAMSSSLGGVKIQIRLPLV
ncbi:ATP-binding protein [Undibacterium sp. SXout7W]|uniref:ATP-binding protein n=1 Tax=Undibacterium sp. SXout7W TaxID=3413049 RepID=UPI003BF0BF97